MAGMKSLVLMRRFSALLLVCLSAAVPLRAAMAADGPFGIDHRIPSDNSGIRARSNLASRGIGTVSGIWAAHEKSPLILGWLPGGLQVGFVHPFKP